MKIYHYENDSGKFTGEGIADANPKKAGAFLVPANATTKAPPAEVAGKSRNWTGTEWELQDLPAVAPEGEQPTAEQQRRKDIFLTLEAIDMESVRPARAVSIALANATEPAAFDVQKLAALEAQAQTLRAELAAL